MKSGRFCFAAPGARERRAFDPGRLTGGCDKQNRPSAATSARVEYSHMVENHPDPSTTERKNTRKTRGSRRETYASVDTKLPNCDLKLIVTVQLITFGNKGFFA